MKPVDLVASTLLGVRRDGDFSCQHFVFVGLERLVERDLQSKEWLDHVEKEPLDRIVE